MIVDLIDRIYDTVLNPDLWPAVLADINIAFGAVSTTLVPLNRPAGVRISPGGEAAQDAYVQHWWNRDSIASAILKSGQLGTFCDWRLLSAEQMARDPFYQEFRLAFDMKHNIAFTADAGEGDFFGVSLQLPRGAAGPPPDDVVSGFEAVGRHVCRAITVARQSGLAERRDDTLSALLANLSSGIALIDESGQVMLANPAFETFERDGLRIVDRRVRAGSLDDQAAIDALLQRLLAGRSGADLPVVSVARPSGRRPLLLTGLPMTGRRREALLIGSPPRCRAMLVAVDPDAAVPARVETMLRRLALSPAEARLACVVGRGLSPREAAAELGLTEGTVRTRLKVVYEKLTVSRQSELTRIVTQLSVLGAAERPGA